MEYSSAFVCLMGMGTVFFGLIGKIVGGMAPAPAPAPVKAGPAPAASAPEPNRQELVAAVSAAIAEELGTDITGVRILSMKKL